MRTALWRSSVGWLMAALMSLVPQSPTLPRFLKFSCRIGHRGHGKVIAGGKGFDAGRTFASALGLAMGRLLTPRVAVAAVALLMLCTVGYHAGAGAALLLANTPVATTRDIRAMIEEQVQGIESFKAKHSDRVAGLEARISEMETAANRPGNRSTETEGELIQNVATGALARTVPPSASIRSFSGSPKQPDAGISVGAIVRAMATGKATPEIRAALVEGTDSAGGYGVPEHYSTQVIDMARARSVVIQAGAQTVPVNGEKQHYLRIVSDPVVAWREELEAVNQSQPVFSRLTFTPRSLAVMVRASRELLEDALNVEQGIEMSISGAFAKEFDRVGLFGSGVVPEPLGIANTPGINTVSGGAAVSNYLAILEARRKILAANGNEPTAVIGDAMTDEAYAGLVDTTGQPLRLPPAIEDLDFYSTSVGDTDLEDRAIVGDFTQLWYGIRTDLRIEPLRELYAATMEVGFLCHMRFDVAVVRPASFSLITVTPA